MIKFAYGIAGAFMCATAIAFLSIANAPDAEARGTDYCQYGRESILFLIDRTTPYDDTDRRTITASTGALVDRLGPGDRIVVATIGEHYTQTRREFSDCVPGCPEVGFVDSLLSSCRAVRARQDRHVFRNRLLSAVVPLTRNPNNARFSGILSTLSETTRAPVGGAAYTQIYVFSDMLENSQAFPWPRFRDMTNAEAMASVRDQMLLPSVRNARVQIAGFGRLHDPDRPYLEPQLDRRLREFWTGYFRAGGASEVMFVPTF